MIFKSSRSEVFLEKGVLKICNKFTGKHACQSAISIKLQSNFIEIALRHGCPPVNLLHIFRIPFSKNTSERLLLDLTTESYQSVWLKPYIWLQYKISVSYCNSYFKQYFFKLMKNFVFYEAVENTQNYIV